MSSLLRDDRAGPGRGGGGAGWSVANVQVVYFSCLLTLCLSCLLASRKQALGKHSRNGTVWFMLAWLI